MSWAAYMLQSICITKMFLCNHTVIITDNYHLVAITAFPFALTIKRGLSIEVSLGRLYMKTTTAYSTTQLPESSEGSSTDLAPCRAYKNYQFYCEAKVTLTSNI